MKTRFAILLIIVQLLLSACSPDSNEIFIQGTWLLAGGPDQGYLLWQFDKGSFVREQEIDKTLIILSHGRYSVLDSEGDVITLRLFDIRGERFTYENEAIEVAIRIDRQQDTIQMGSDLFARADP